RRDPVQVSVEFLGQRPQRRRLLRGELAGVGRADRQLAGPGDVLQEGEGVEPVIVAQAGGAADVGAVGPHQGLPGGRGQAELRRRGQLEAEGLLRVVTAPAGGRFRRRRLGGGRRRGGAGLRAFPSGRRRRSRRRRRVRVLVVV